MLPRLRESFRPSNGVPFIGLFDSIARLDDYRILYEIDDTMKLVTIVKVGNRREVHR